MVSCPFGFTGAYQFQDGTVHLGHCFHGAFTLGFTQPGPSRPGRNWVTALGLAVADRRPRKGAGHMERSFPKDPTKKELRTLIGFRLVGIAFFLGMAAWRAWEGDYLWSALSVLLTAILFAVYVAPRMLQLRRKKKE